MITRFNKYNKWKDYYSLKETEVRISIIGTVLIIIFLRYLHVYEDFKLFEPAIKEILLYLLAGFLGMIGFALSGIAIITSLFTDEQVKRIEKTGNQEVVERIMCSYEFLAFSVGVLLVVVMLLYISLFSSRDIVSAWLFWIITVVICYCALFSVFYMIALVGSTIRLYKIKNICVTQNATQLLPEINQIVIDFILLYIIEKNSITLKELYSKIETKIIESSLETEKKCQILDYLRNHYDIGL
jgi:magnesium-transporting ATPase (P-type)|nr:MAG TPA: protein of unknown function (DUF5316) [Caudoviricetes sp.]